MYPYISVLDYQIPTYYICILVGLFGIFCLASLQTRKKIFGISLYNIIYLLLSIVIGTLVGAKIFQLVGHIIRDGHKIGFWTVSNLLHLLSGVGVFYGGLIGGLIASVIYCRRNNINYIAAADILTPCILLFNIFGRLGCFFAGCCYGCESSWGIQFHNSLLAPNDVTLIPVQLFESGFNLLMLCIILIIRPEKKRKGILLPIYFIAYSIQRFVLEFFRGDIGRGVFILSTSQWISIIILPLGILALRFVLVKKPDYNYNFNEMAIIKRKKS